MFRCEYCGNLYEVFPWRGCETCGARRLEKISDSRALVFGSEDYFRSFSSGSPGDWEVPITPWRAWPLPYMVSIK